MAGDELLDHLDLAAKDLQESHRVSILEAMMPADPSYALLRLHHRLEVYNRDAGLRVLPGTKEDVRREVDRLNEEFVAKASRLQAEAASDLTHLGLTIDLPSGGSGAVWSAFGEFVIADVACFTDAMVEIAERLQQDEPMQDDLESRLSHREATVDAADHLAQTLAAQVGRAIQSAPSTAAIPTWVDLVLKNTKLVPALMRIAQWGMSTRFDDGNLSRETAEEAVETQLGREEYSRFFRQLHARTARGYLAEATIWHAEGLVRAYEMAKRCGLLKDVDREQTLSATTRPAPWVKAMMAVDTAIEENPQSHLTRKLVDQLSAHVDKVRCGAFGESEQVQLLLESTDKTIERAQLATKGWDFGRP